MGLPSDFIFGSATAAFQIEGASSKDGKGESIWDRFCRLPGAIEDASSGDLACDHFHRYEEDIDLLKELGVDAYRFSISWPRILPSGSGKPNLKGLDFYKRLVESLLRANIRPFATLYHWDLPQTLEDQGGWVSRETALRFGEYAAVTVEALSDLIKDWITLNEPHVTAVYGYSEGMLAPGRRETPANVVRVMHNELLAHGLAVRAVREYGAKGSEVGIVLSPYVFLPASDDPKDMAASDMLFHFENGWWLDPLYKGVYPEGNWRLLEGACPSVKPGDLDIISEPTDFLGLNVYSGEEAFIDPTSPAGARGIPLKNRESTAMGWTVCPESIYQAITKISREYPVKKVYITENGAAYPDVISEDGKVHDPKRIEFIEDYFAQVMRTIDEGCPVNGYFVWSLLDNFEWHRGYTKRFGLVYTDYADKCRRIPKDSYYYYQELIKTLSM